MDLKSNLKEYLLYPIIFFVAGGFVLGVLLCEKCWSDTNFLWKNFTYQGLFWGMFTFGSQRAIVVANHYISWLNAPLKRFLLGLALMIVFTIIGFLLIFFFSQMVIWGNSFSQIVDRFDGWYFLSPILITFGVNAFMHGREFLLAWRQNAINYEKLKTEQVATQYDSLKNQVNPHFLFNSLNALTSLVYDDQEKAVEFIRMLSKVYRYVLDSKDKEVIPIVEEIAFLESYMYLQKIRFDENLIYEINLPQEVHNTYVVPISLQMLLENAIKHNIISLSKPLTIKLYHKDDYLIIENNLQEKIHKDSTGIGLSNIKARYSYVTDKPVEVIKLENVFKVKIPLITSA